MRGYTPTDKVFLGFLALDTVVLLAHARDVREWPLLLGVNALCLLLVMLVSRLENPRGLSRYIAGAYPLLMTAAFYPQIGIINTGVGLVHDHTIQQWEALLFGSQVSVTWHQSVPSLPLSSILHICYGSFYWLLLLVPAFLFFRHSNDHFERVGFVLSLVLYVCYACFALYPVAGPRYFFGVADGPEAQVWAARVVHEVLEGGSAWGTAFPSSHVAAAWAATWVLWKDARLVALLLMPVALGVPFGTVYGQFHYGVDALAGALVAVALCAAADPLRARLTARRGPTA